MNFRLGYFLREALLSFRRNLVMSFASVSAVAVSLLVLGSFVILTFALNGLIKDVEKDFGYIKIFLLDTAPQNDVDNLQRRLGKDKLIESVRFVSKEEALDELRKDLKDQPELLENLDVNPLPASLEIKVRDPKTVADVVKKIGTNKRVIEEVKYGEQTAERLFSVTQIIRLIGSIFIGLLSFASLVLISNTIRLAIFSRRKEIGIMKLVGASNWFIRWPFLLEGVIQGLLGAAIASLLLYFANTSLLTKAKEIIPFLPVAIGGDLFTVIIIYMLLGGIAIGAIGSTLALRKFLQV